MRSVISSLVLSFVLLAAAQPVHAVRIRQKESILVINHERGQVDVESPAGTKIRTLELAEKIPLEIESGETIRVRVANPNPLLFKYEWEGIAKTETADHKAAAEFAKAARSLLTILAPFGTQATAADASEAEQMQVAEIKKDLPGLTAADRSVVGQLITQLGQLTTWAEEIPGLIDKSAKAPEEVKQTVVGWKVEATAEAVEKNLDLLNAIEIRLMKDIQATGGDGGLRGLSGDSQEKDSAKNKNQSVEKGKDKASSDPSEGTGKQNPEMVVPSGGVNSSVVLLLLAKDQEPEVRKMLAKVKDFATVAETIHVAISLEPPLEFDATNDSGGFLTISAVEANAVSAAKAKLKTGRFDFPVSPASPVHYSIGAGAVYSFIEQPEFGAETVDGTTTIVRKDNGNDVNGVVGAVMLSITPDRWSHEIFGGSFQLGLSPVKDKIGIFLGGSIRLYDLVSVGLGVAYQETERLADGLRLGQEIATPDALKTDTVFKSGLYLTLTVDLTKFN